MDEIIPNIWISDLCCALSIEHLTTANISHIITATSSRLALPTLPSNRQIDQLHIRIDDDNLAPIIVHFDASNKFIAEAIGVNGNEKSEKEDRVKNNVLVHCHAGISRSVTLVAAYIMWNQNLSPSETLEMIKARRPAACPNEGFLQQLELYSQISHNLDVSNQAFRRFLLGYTSRSILNGSPIDDALLSYYPTPLSSPSNSMKTEGLPMLDRDEGGRLRVMTSTTSDHKESNIGPSNEKRSQIAQQKEKESEKEEEEIEMLSALSLGGRLPGGVKEVKGLSSKFHPLVSSSNSSNTSSSASTSITSGNQNSNNSIPTSTNPISNFRKPSFKGQLVLRCKKCGRELAAKEHVVEHEVGERGQNKGNFRIGGKKLEKDSERILSGPDGVRIGSNSITRSTSGTNDSSPLENQEVGVKQEEEEQRQDLKENKSNDERSQPQEQQQQPKFQSAASLSARLPPNLAALRRGAPIGGNGNLNPNRPPVSKPTPKSKASPAASTPSTNDSSSTSISISTLDSSPEPQTPPQSQSQSQNRSFESQPRLPLLHSPLCSSYFIEPLQWMSSLLLSGEIEGKLICPGGTGGTASSLVSDQSSASGNEEGEEVKKGRSCGAKLGNWDWAGFQCGCGTWITPAFTLARTKVDEIQT